MCQTSITAASFETDSKPGHGGAIAFVIILIVILLGGCFYKRVEVLHYGTIAYMRLHSCLTTIRPFGRIRTNSHQVSRLHVFRPQILRHNTRLSLKCVSKYSRLGSGNGSDGEDDLLFGMDTVEDAVFPLVPGLYLIALILRPPSLAHFRPRIYGSQAEYCLKKSKISRKHTNLSRGANDDTLKGVCLNSLIP